MEGRPGILGPAHASPWQLSGPLPTLSSLETTLVGSLGFSTTNSLDSQIHQVVHLQMLSHSPPPPPNNPKKAWAPFTEKLTQTPYAFLAAELGLEISGSLSNHG